jgi:hypothetical protein
MKSVLREKVSISSMTWPYFLIYQALTEVCLSCYLAGSLVVFFYPFPNCQSPDFTKLAKVLSFMCAHDPRMILLKNGGQQFIQYNWLAVLAVRKKGFVYNLKAGFA